MFNTPLVAAVLALAAGLQTPAAPAGRAVFADTSHAFGDVTHGAVLTHTFVVRNESQEPLVIKAVELHAEGMNTSYQGRLAPGASGRITLEWNTSSASGPTEVKATVLLSDPKLPKVELTLSATVKRRIEIQPMPAVYFSVYQGDTLTRSVTILNHEARPLTILGVEPRGTHFEARVAPLTPGKAYRLDVTVPRTAEAGRFMEAVHVRTDHPDFPLLEVKVNVFVKHDIYVAPEVLDLGNISLAELEANPALIQLLTYKLIVRKRAGQFTLRSVTTDVPGLSVRTDDTKPAEAFEIVVAVVRERLTPGPIKGVVRIETSDPAFPRLEVPVSGSVR